MIQLLLVEDDPGIGRSLNIFLGLEGYQIHWAQDLRTAGRISSAEKLDAIILDLGLPDGSGLSFLKKLRESDSKIPVIVLTAKTDEDSVVEGLQSGANDYIRKPFGNRELLARIKLVTGEPDTRKNKVRFENLVLLVDQRRVLFGETEIPLHRREFDVLSCLLKNAEAVVTRNSLLDTLDKDGEMTERTIDSHVSHVRARLRTAGVKDIRISSVYGVGYRLEKRK